MLRHLCKTLLYASSVCLQQTDKLAANVNLFICDKKERHLISFGCNNETNSRSNWTSTNTCRYFWWYGASKDCNHQVNLISLWEGNIARSSELNNSGKMRNWDGTNEDSFSRLNRIKVEEKYHFWTPNRSPLHLFMLECATQVDAMACS